MAKIAFVCVGLPGHILPSMPVMHELNRRGHGAAYIVGGNNAARGAVMSTYGTYIGWYYPSDFLPQDRTPQRFNGFNLPDLPRMMADEITTSLPSIKDALEQAAPDLCIVDGYTPAGFLACETIGIPVVRADATYATNPNWSYFKMCESGDLLGSLTSPESLDYFRATIDSMFPDRGALGDFHSMMNYRGDRNLCYVSPLLHPATAVYQNMNFVGPTITDEGAPPLAVQWKPDSAGRRVLVSFGSIFDAQPALAEMLAQALAELDCDVTWCVHSAKRFNAPEGDYGGRVRVCLAEPSARLLRLLSSADLFISHGGMGGVQESLWRGCPTLCIPQFPEQLITAKLLDDHGLGMFMHPDFASVAALRHGISTILGNADYKDAARNWSCEMRLTDGIKAAADIVEAAIPARLAIHRP